MNGDPNAVGAKGGDVAEKDSSNTSTSGKKRKQNGRSWRRRKAKLKAIEAAAEEQLKGHDVTIPGRPHDREESPQGVLERRKVGGGIPQIDEHALIRQLGFLPGNAVCVAARSDRVPDILKTSDPVPIVLKLYPLALREPYAGGRKDGRKFKSRKRGPTTEQQADDEKKSMLLEPFPTLYWLTHPLLKTLVSKLELGKDFNSKVLEQRLLRDAEALESMNKAHSEYGIERKDLLTPADAIMLESKGWTDSLGVARGVAGIRRPHSIKCLHAHLAHHLSGGRGSEYNIVGKWVLEEIERIVRDKESEKKTETAG